MSEFIHPGRTSTFCERVGESDYFPAVVLFTLGGALCLTIGSIALSNIGLSALEGTPSIVMMGVGSGFVALNILTLYLIGKPFSSLTQEELETCQANLGGNEYLRGHWEKIKKNHEFDLTGGKGEWITHFRRGNPQPLSNRQYDEVDIGSHERTMRLHGDIRVSKEELLSRTNPTFLTKAWDLHYKEYRLILAITAIAIALIIVGGIGYKHFTGKPIGITMMSVGSALIVFEVVLLYWKNSGHVHLSKANPHLDKMEFHNFIICWRSEDWWCFDKFLLHRPEPEAEKVRITDYTSLGKLIKTENKIPISFTELEKLPK